jgi:hypothetical protein
MRYIRRVRYALAFLLLTGCEPPAPDAEPTGIVVRGPAGDCANDCVLDLGELTLDLETRVALAIANVGREAITGITVSFADGASPSFSLVQAPQATVEGRRTAPLLVAIRPRVPGEIRGEIVASAANDQVIHLGIIANATGEGIVLGENRVCDFGQVAIGETSPPCAVTFINASATTLNLTYISVLPNIYSITPEFSDPIPLAPLEQHTIEIRATPFEAVRTFGSFTYAYEDRIIGGGVSLSVEGI